MNIRVLVTFVILQFALLYVSAQQVVPDSTVVVHDIFSEINDDSEGGKIQIYQDPILHVLIDKNTRINKKEGLWGYRIQIFSGSGQNARDKSFAIQTEFVEQFPDFDKGLIYNIYQAPFFKLRLGDYRSKNEAVEFYHQLKEFFPNSYIVKSKINFPKLDSEQE